MHIVHTESSSGWGGPAIRILTEAAGLVQRGHRVTLLAPPAARIHVEARAWGIESAALPIESRTPRGLFALARWLHAARDVDLINTHGSIDSWLASLAVRLVRRNLPVVCTRHSSAPVKATAGNCWLYGKAARRVVTSGEALRRELIDTLGLDFSHVVSVPTGIDLARFSPQAAPTQAQARKALNLPLEGYMIGVAANLTACKGHEDLLAAFESVAGSYPDMTLVIAGEGPLRPHLEAIRQASAYRQRILMPGHQENVPVLLAALNLFVLPSQANEGVPQAIVQAMAMRLPVISTTVGAISDAVADGETGLLLPPRAPDLLANAIRRLRRNHMLGRSFGDAGRLIVERKFTAEGMVDAMLDVFERCAAGNARGAALASR
ncbi:MAG: glycosyltransferase family 4 protein [Rhodocyclaceae bacterium]|nr:glycosyltransferase family 4 protein [Rhodocyclaceae bacterium]